MGPIEALVYRRCGKLRRPILCTFTFSYFCVSADVKALHPSSHTSCFPSSSLRVLVRMRMWDCLSTGERRLTVDHRSPRAKGQGANNFSTFSPRVWPSSEPRPLPMPHPRLILPCGHSALVRYVGSGDVRVARARGVLRSPGAVRYYFLRGTQGTLQRGAMARAGITRRKR